MPVIRRSPSLLAAFCGILGLISCGAAADLPRFETKELDPNVGKVCYALTLADVDGDKKTDIVAVTENRVVWFANPDWRMRVMIADATELDNVCIAPMDIDGDGKVDFTLGAGWLNGKNLGTIHWLTRGASLDEPWSVHPIGRESFLHRMRWGDILGTGKPQLVISPLTKSTAPGVRVQAFEIPASPKTDPWKATVLDEEFNGMHNHWMGDLDGDGKVDLITASMEGVYLFRRGADGKLKKTMLGEGAPGPKAPQKSGAGEIKVGKMKGGKPILATVEPMHGNQIVIYTPPAGALDSGPWTRNVLDDTVGRGHALGFADIDRDGIDELVAGHSEKGTGNPAGPGVFIYKSGDDPAAKWTKHIVDNGGVATEDLMVDDLNGDGWPDIVAGGRNTHNVRLYINTGRAN